MLTSQNEFLQAFIKTYKHVLVLFLLQCLRSQNKSIKPIATAV